MSAFWENFGDAGEVSIEVLGEVVEIGGVELRAVVQDAASAPRIVAGGLSGGVTLALHVSQEAGDAVLDGALVLARTLEGRVLSKEPLGAGWVILVGPANRWDEGSDFE